jgi:rubrerythrin
MTKISKKMLKYFIKDEKKAVKEYRKYGLDRLARDEARHRKFLIKKLKEKLKQR